MGSHLMSFSFLTTWHNYIFLSINIQFLIASKKSTPAKTGVQRYTKVS
jgi:hypothetical protein